MDDDANLPESFFCPISGRIFEDPVLSPGGHTYERGFISRWLENHDTSPLTRQTISVDDLRPNRVLRGLLDDWRQREARYDAERRTNRRYIIPFEELTLGLGDIGSGSFKIVERGSWRGREVAVAVMRDGLTHAEREISMLGQLGRHPHIVTFHGVAKGPCGKEHLVTELAPCGSLGDVLADLADSGADIEPPVLLAVAQQVSAYKPASLTTRFSSSTNRRSLDLFG